MIPTIGIMIGFYILTRMISFITRGGERKEKLAVRIFAIITIIFTVISMIDLLNRGTQGILP